MGSAMRIRRALSLQLFPAIRNSRKQSANLTTSAFPSLTPMSSYKPPAGYETRPVVVLGGGVLGRRIGTECQHHHLHC